MPELTSNEKVLSGIAIVVVTASLALALCIGLILPRHWTTEGYINNKYDKNAEEMSLNCGCGRKKITTNYIHCVPRTFSNRVSHPTNDTPNKPGDVCELVQDFPYVVSLHVAAYEDDNKERRFACSGTILSKEWVLIGEDCVLRENEFAVVKLRAGSTYWSTGGKEYPLGALSKFSDEGPTAVKVSRPLEFGINVNAVRLSKKGMYTTWISAVSVGWRKGENKKHDKFVVQKWTTAPCTDNCRKGEIIGNPACSKNIFERALVAENRLLVGLQTGYCDRGNISKIMFVDVQTEEYQTWFEFLLEEHEESKMKTPLQPLERKLKGTTASPLNIFGVRECAVRESNDVRDSDISDGFTVVKENKIQTNIASDKTKAPEIHKKTDTATITEISKKPEHTEKSEENEQNKKTEATEHTTKTDEAAETDVKNTEPTSSTEATTIYNPPIFQDGSNMRNLPPFSSRIDETDEYRDNDYDSDGDGKNVFEDKLQESLSTNIPNEVNYRYR